MAIEWFLLITVAMLFPRTIWDDTGSACGHRHLSYVDTTSGHGIESTWHPPTAQFEDGTVCHFGHEHGSDPARFIAANKARPVIFGQVDRLAGREEPHNGVKVFVVEDDEHGLAYRIVVHQGTGPGRRALMQHHEVQIAIVGIEMDSVPA